MTTCCGPLGQLPDLSFERAELAVGGVVAAADALAGDGLAVRPRMSAASVSSGETTPPAAPTSGSSWTLVSRAAGIVAEPVGGALDDLLAADDGVGLVVGGGEESIEGLLHRVGEDVGAADHRDADDDGEGGEERADLAAGEPLEGDADHRPLTASSVVEDLVGGGRPEVADDVAVGEEQHAVGDRRGVRVVGDHHGRLAERVDRVAQQRRGSRRWWSSRGCRWARRRTSRDGRETSARATATRCCWPPESSEGRCLRRSREADAGDDLVEPGLVRLDAGERAAAARCSRPPSASAAG